MCPHLAQTFKTTPGVLHVNHPRQEDPTFHKGGGGGGGGGGGSLIDYIVGQRSTVKAIQKGAVNDQSAFRSTQSTVKLRSEVLSETANLGGVTHEVKGRSMAKNQRSQ